MMFALLLLATAPVDHPKTFLASVQGISLKRDEMIEKFSFSTWGVEFVAVCRIPSGWTITAGGSLDPSGVFEGEGSMGVSMPRTSNPATFRSLVLLKLYAPVQRRNWRSTDGSAEVPATFNGSATLSDGDTERKAPLSFKNVRLVPALHCPS
jgi:hypothetical protein